MRILLTDGETRTALAAARSLGRGGHVVFVVAPCLPALATVSRFVHEAAQVPDVREAPRSFVSEVRRLVQTWGIDLVLPVSDPSMSALLDLCGRRVGEAGIAGPPPEAYHALTNKRDLLVLAQRLEIPVPPTAEADGSEVLEESADRVGYPCVLKSHESAYRVPGGFGHSDVAYVEGRDQLMDAAGRFPPSAYPLLIQHRIFGPGEGVFLLVHDGACVAAFAHRRLREYPPSGGSSTYRESIRLPTDLFAWSERLLGTVGWEGVAMVEFKRCSTTGQAFLMEVNGRLWGSLQLAIHAGVDFPNLIARACAGESVDQRLPYRVGIRTRWLRGDLLYMLSRAKHGAAALYLDPAAPSPFRAAASYTALWRRRERLEVCDARDLRPFVHELGSWVRERFSRR